MLRIRPKYDKLRTSLQSAKHRLIFLQSKNLELSENKKEDIKKHLKNGKFALAKITAQTAIKYKANEEAMALIELSCSQLLERYALFQQTKVPDISLIKPVSNLIWVAPYFCTLVEELKVILKILTSKYGRRFRRKAAKNKYGHVSSELIEKVESISPSNERIELYLKAISSECGVGHFEKGEKSCRDNNPHGQMERNQSSEGLTEEIQVDVKSEGFNKAESSTSEKTAGKNEDEVVKSTSTDVESSYNVLESSSGNEVLENQIVNTLAVTTKLSEPIDRSEAVLDDGILKNIETAFTNVDLGKTDYNEQGLFNNSSGLLHSEPSPSCIQCISDTNSEVNTKRGMFHRFNTFQFPKCPCAKKAVPNASSEIIVNAER